MSDRSIYVKNLGKNKFVKDPEDHNWISEHDRLNMEPIKLADVKQDFMYSKKTVKPKLSTPPPVTDNDPMWANKEIAYEDVPSPPETPFQHEDEVGMDISEVKNGDYCLLISGRLLCASSSQDEIEELLNKLVFGEKPVPIDDISIVKKLEVKVGVSVCD